MAMRGRWKAGVERFCPHEVVCIEKRQWMGVSMSEKMELRLVIDGPALKGVRLRARLEIFDGRLPDDCEPTTEELTARIAAEGSIARRTEAFCWSQRERIGQGVVNLAA